MLSDGRRSDQEAERQHPQAPASNGKGSCKRLSNNTWKRDYPGRPQGTLAKRSAGVPRRGRTVTPRVLGKQDPKHWQARQRPRHREPLPSEGSPTIVSVRGAGAVRRVGQAGRSKTLSERRHTALSATKQRGPGMSSASTSTIAEASAPSRRDRAGRESAHDGKSEAVSLG